MKEHAHHAHAAKAPAHGHREHEEDTLGHLAEAQAARGMNVEGRIVRVSAEGDSTVLLVAKRPEDPVHTMDELGWQYGYVKGLGATVWVRSVSEDGRMVTCVASGVSVDQMSGDNRYEHVVFNASHLPESDRVLKKETQARILQTSVDEEGGTRIMIGLGRRDGGKWGMEGRIVGADGGAIAGGTFQVNDAGWRTLGATVHVPPADLAGAHVILKPHE